MTKSYILEEIHQIRKNYAERFDNDLHAICQDARHKQRCSNRQVIPANPKPIQNKNLEIKKFAEEKLNP
jgi:hypothetical protein